jgi:hypothetical protein
MEGIDEYHCNSLGLVGDQAGSVEITALGYGTRKGSERLCLPVLNDDGLGQIFTDVELSGVCHRLHQSSQNPRLHTGIAD